MITLRTATRDDIPVLASVLANVQAQADPSIDVEEQRRGMTEAINGYFGLDEPESILSIVEYDGVPVGRLRVVRFDDRIFLGGLQIHPDFQRRGIGTELVTALQDESRSAGKPLVLTVERDNTRARTLYERLGFELNSESDQEVQLAYTPN
ncbi:GNAT family N-acetyltransferase [Kribbella sp. NPDC051586]|uniref:GNAT family N-acetyltransferase n=1 Tax=Kribbella sp. NPDC051586 TaxID=3364118 RepID=UPI0037905046